MTRVKRGKKVAKEIKKVPAPAIKFGSPTWQKKYGRGKKKG